MPQAQTSVQVAHGEVQELTDGDVQAITFQVTHGHVLIVRAASAPQPDAAGWLYSKGQGERGLALDDLSSATGNRVFAIGQAHPTSRVTVDHA